MLSGTSFLTAGTSHYGHPAGVQFRACKSYPEATLCSPSWSTEFALPGIAVWNSVPGGLVFAEDSELGNGAWTWTSAPAGSYTAVEFRCRAGGAWQPMPQVGECAALLTGSNDLRVRITVNGQTYDRSYDPGDYTP